MAKKNKTLCFDGEICEFLEQQGNMSEYISDLIRREMNKFPDIENISFERKKFFCPICSYRAISDEKEPLCKWCGAKRLKTIMKEVPPRPPPENLEANV